MVLDHSDSIHMHIKPFKNKFYVRVCKKWFLLYEQRGQKVRNNDVFLCLSLGKPQKKVIFLMAGGGGGRVKG